MGALRLGTSNWLATNRFNPSTIPEELSDNLFIGIPRNPSV
jgi:hypothetical protein